jgi:hypothetical protein
LSLALAQHIQDFDDGKLAIAGRAAIVEARHGLWQARLAPGIRQWLG